MRLTLVRHATLIVEMDGRRILVDPMLDEAGARPPIDNTPNQVRNPVWYDEVEGWLDQHRPRVAVVNAGGARFLDGDPITMAPADVAEVAARVATVVAVHMEAINHCVVSRAELRAAVPGVHVPEDGETADL